MNLGGTYQVLSETLNKNLVAHNSVEERLFVFLKLSHLVDEVEELALDLSSVEVS